MNDPVETLIRYLRLLATTTGLSPEGEALMRTLAETSPELRQQLRALAA